jgi:hypothetical protein
MQQIINTLIFASFMIFFMTTCDKNGPVEEPPVIVEDTSFCGYINDEKFDKTRWQIDSFLMSLPRNDDLNSIDSLVIWLKQKDCIIDAKVHCYGCLLSIPPQTEIFLKIKMKDQSFNAILFIEHFDPIRFGGIYKR